MKKVAAAITGFLLILLVWLAGASYVRTTRTDLTPAVIERLYPLPHQVITAALEIPLQDILQEVKLSAFRVMIGFGLAALCAVPAGILIGRVQFIARMLEPANDFLRYLPVAGFSSLTIFLLGTGNASAVTVVFIGTVFHLVVAIADAVRRVPAAYLDLAHTLSYPPLRRLTHIIIPAAAPAIFDNLRIAVGWAWSYVTLAEIMGTTGGLGQAIEVSRRYIRTDQVLWWIALIGLLGLLSDQLMRAVSRHWFRWAANAK
jgi:NitT/TauT family transport system permease protein